MGRIHLLDDAVINKIAAGEVVERPASVVKELVENAIDAGATRVDVALELGGTRSIVVTDDGRGIAPDDAPRALQRHATSKIRSADDLFSIGTMGFRGEALASIASVSRFSLSTRARGEADGVRLVTAGGEPPKTQPWSGPEGTTIAVESLFFNMPVRAKFLKAPATELSHCLELMQALALCHPEVAFTLTHNGREQLRVAAQPRAEGEAAEWIGEAALRARAAAVLPKDAAPGLVYVRAPSRWGDVEALVSPPGVEKATGKLLLTFVNGRWVKDKVLRYGVMRGYHSHLLKGRYPVAVVHLRLDPTLVDVNVHPAKTELRFQYANELQNALALAIRERLRDAEWAGADGAAVVPGLGGRMPAGADGGHDTAGEDGVAGEHGYPLAAGPGGAAGEHGGLSAGPSGGFGPRAFAQSIGPTRAAPLGGEPRRAFGASTQRSVFGRAAEAGAYGAPADDSSEGPVYGARRAPPAFASSTTRRAAFDGAGADGGGAGHEHAYEPVSTPEDLQRLLGAPAEPRAAIPWDELEPLGSFDRCYLFFSAGDRLLVMDQHAFHERVLYERLARDEALLGTSQPLLVPESVELSPTEVAALRARRHLLAQRGFAFELDGDTTISVHAVPAILAGRSLADLFADLARAEADPGAARGEDAADTNAELARHVLATAACHAAVRAGEELGANELRQLLSEARTVDFYHNCPHGRRVFRWWSKGQVAQWFDR